MTQVKLPSRVADYFLVVGTDTGKPKENLHDKRATQKVAFEAKVLERFPLTDYKDAEFPRDVQMFCFPFGLLLSPTSVGESHNFILTEQDGTRLFGSCYTFYEEYAPESKGDQKMYVPKALAVISHWPFLHQFNRFLSQLYKVVSKHAEIKFPLERAIANFILEIPLPPPGRLEVECKSLGQQLFRRPPPNKMPLRDFNLNDLFRCLSVDNILLLYAAVLAERRVLLVSSKLKRLTIAAECICYLLFPMFWRHIYIPVLPIQLIDFVCAPMPFLVGVHSSYLPDEIMLDQVVVVELDKNAIRQNSDDPVAPLSDRAMAHFQRGLKKLVGDTTTPIKVNQILNEDVIEQIFLGNMARMLARYRDYLEAPSEFVIDKFNKTKFVAEHDEKCKFLSDFMETQMFQCFVDDRYDSAAHRGNNLEVLFFDESIDAANGKPTPFLSDTSHAHQASAKVIALSPNVEGLPRGKTYSYRTFPGKLLPELFYPVREIKALTEEKVQNKVDMSKLNMKFFTEKRLYSQHFHSLRLRSSKQDLAFKDVMAYLKRSQEHDESFTTAFDRMCAITIDRDTIETGTTIDGAWQALKKSVSRQSVLEAAAFKRIRDDCWRPLDGVASAAEHQLKILFQEANILEQKAGHCKAIVERAKAKSNVMQLKYENLKSQLSSAGSLSSSDIHRIVQTQSEAEDAALQLDETETGFQTIVQEYETRMPEIIKTIRRLNTERIEQFKYSMEQWTSQKREVLQGMIKSLDTLTDAVKSINAQKDLVSFSEGSTDFWNIGRLRGDSKGRDGHNNDTTTSPVVMEVSEAELLNPTPSTQPMSSSTSAPSSSSSLTDPIATTASRERLPASPPPPPQPSTTAVTSLKLAPGAPLSYTINLWAGNGFQTAFDQATVTKHAVKELIACLQEWSIVQDAKSRKLSALQRSAETLPQQTTEKNLWMAIRNRTNIQSKAYNDMQAVLTKLSSDLRVTKGELKHSMRRFADHKASLERELKDSNDVLLKAHDKRVRARMAFTTVENLSRQSVLKSTSVAVATVVKESDKLDKASREFKEAEQLYILADRDRQAKQVKHDVCLARILRLFEKKEKHCGNHLKMAVSVVMDCCQNYLHTAFVAADDQVMTSLKKVDVETDLKAFVESTYDANTPPHLKLADGERVDLAKHMGLAGFDASLSMLGRGVVSTKGLWQYLDEHTMIDDQEIKMMRKVIFKVKSCTAGTLGTAYMHFDSAMEKVQSVMEMEMKNLKSSIAPLISLRQSLKASIKTQEKTYSELERTYRKAQEENDKAHQDELRAQQALTSARGKVQGAQDELKAAAADSKRKASIFSRIAGTPLDKLQAAENAAKKDLEAARVTLQRRQASLQEAIDLRASGIEKLLRHIRVIEEGRFVSLRDAMAKMLELHQGSLNELQRLIISVTDKVKLVNLDADIQSFLAAKNTGHKPPDCVIEDHIRASGVETKQRAADKEREKNRNTKSGGAVSPTSAAAGSSSSVATTNNMASSGLPSPSSTSSVSSNKDSKTGTTTLETKDGKSSSTPASSSSSGANDKKDDGKDEKKLGNLTPSTSTDSVPRGKRERAGANATVNGGIHGRRASRWQPLSSDKPALPPGSKPKPPRRPAPAPQPSPSHASVAAAAVTSSQPSSSLSSSSAGSTSTTMSSLSSTTAPTLTSSSSDSTNSNPSGNGGSGSTTVVLGALEPLTSTDDEVIDFSIVSPTAAAAASAATGTATTTTNDDVVPFESKSSATSGDDSDDDTTPRTSTDIIDVPTQSAMLIRVQSADSDSDSDDERSTNSNPNSNSNGTGGGSSRGSRNGGNGSGKPRKSTRVTAAELLEMSPDLRRPRKSAYEDSDDEKDEEAPTSEMPTSPPLTNFTLPPPPLPPASSSLIASPARPPLPPGIGMITPVRVASSATATGTPSLSRTGSASPSQTSLTTPSTPPPLLSSSSNDTPATPSLAAPPSPSLPSTTGDGTTTRRTPPPLPRHDSSSNVLKAAVANGNSTPSTPTHAPQVSSTVAPPST